MRLTVCSHLRNGHGLFVRHVAQVGEYHQTGVEASEGVHHASDEAVPVAVVGEGVVGGVGQVDSEARTDREEYLYRRFVPNLRKHLE